MLLITYVIENLRNVYEEDFEEHFDRIQENQNFLTYEFFQLSNIQNSLNYKIFLKSEFLISKLLKL